jgi:hypothetical protein
MAYVKTIALLLFGLFLSAGVAAQTCDLTMGPMVVSYKGKVKFEEKGQVYHDLTTAEAQAIVKRSQSILDVASKGQDKGGDYAFTFDGSNTCAITMAPITTPGLSYHDSIKVLRQAYGKVADGTIKQSEEHVAKGGKGPWGKTQ